MDNEISSEVLFKKITYTKIIENVFLESTKKMISTNEIISTLKTKYPKFNNKNISIKTIRHTLSFKKKFKKTKIKNPNGRGFLWVLENNNDLFGLFPIKEKKKQKQMFEDNFFIKNYNLYLFLSKITKTIFF